MKTTAVVLRGVLTADGKLELEGKPDLPPGPVQVSVETVEEATAGRGWWEVLQDIRREQKARGHRGRTREEIDAEIAGLRAEWEGRQLRIEQLQEEARRAREDRGCHEQSA